MKKKSGKSTAKGKMKGKGAKHAHKGSANVCEYC